MKRQERILSLLSDAWKSRNQGNYEEAKRMTREAQQLCDEADHLLLGRVFHVYMQMEYDHKRYVTALDFAKDSLAHYEASGKAQHIAHSRRHIADLYRHLSRFNSAETNYRQAIAIYRSESTTGTLDLANALRGYGMLLEHQDKDNQAYAVWEEVRELYDSLRIDAGVKEAEEHLEKLTNSN